MVSNYQCPKCNSYNVDFTSFDFTNYCRDCDYEWEAIHISYHGE